MNYAGDRITTTVWESNEFNPLPQYTPIRFDEVPPIEIILIDRPREPALGAGEPAIGTLGGAVANAVFAATGKRIRTLPITPQRVLTHSSYDGDPSGRQGRLPADGHGPPGRAGGGHAGQQAERGGGDAERRRREDDDEAEREVAGEAADEAGERVRAGGGAVARHDRRRRARCSSSGTPRRRRPPPARPAAS